MRLKDKNILLIVAPEGFHDDEVFKPSEAFAKEGANVTVAASRTGTLTGMFQGNIEVDTLFTEINPDDFDSIVLIGGQGARKLYWLNKDLHALVQAFNEKKKLVASICVAGVILANAGVLKGKNATVYHTSEDLDLLQKGGANYVNELVVIDGNIITGNGPAAVAKFVEAITEALSAVPV